MRNSRNAETILPRTWAAAKLLAQCFCAARVLLRSGRSLRGHGDFNTVFLVRSPMFERGESDLSGYAAAWVKRRKSPASVSASVGNV
jgi:hypothetical protein